MNFFCMIPHFWCATLRATRVPACLSAWQANEKPGPFKFPIYNLTFIILEYVSIEAIVGKAPATFKNFQRSERLNTDWKLSENTYLYW